MHIHIAFQEGFHGETVIARLNNVEIYRKSGLKTRMQIGLADKFEYDTVQPVNELYIEISTPDVTKNKTISIGNSYETYIGISIDPDGHISCKMGNEPFRYA
jgi:hypothetical protein